MDSNVTFFELLKETTELMRDYRPFCRGQISRQIFLVLQRQLVKLLPKAIADYNLQSHEMLFFSAILVEPDACRDILRTFSRFWACSHEGALKIEVALEISIRDGKLSGFIEEAGNGRIRIKDDLRIRFLSTIVCPQSIAGT